MIFGTEVTQERLPQRTTEKKNENHRESLILNSVVLFLKLCGSLCNLSS